MKNIVSKFAIAFFATVCLTQSTAQAQSSNFIRSENTVISFDLGTNQSPNAKIIIRNSNGQVVKTKSFFSKYCNIESIFFQSGTYSYTIVNGNVSSTGTFSIK